MNDIVPQGSTLAHPAMIQSRSLLSNSSLPTRTSPHFRKHEETSKGGALETGAYLNDDDDRPSQLSSDTSFNDSLGSNLQGPRENAWVSASPFETYHKERMSIARVTHKVFETMQTVLSEKKDSDDGQIYTLRLAELPGFVKIGRTKNPIDRRKAQISRCITYSLEVMNDDDFCPVENHTRVKRLIHDEH